MQALQPRLSPLSATIVGRDATTLRTQLQLAQLPAPTGHEGRRAERVSQEFSRIDGASVRTDRTGNVIAQRRGSQPAIDPIVCMAHIDTVFALDTPLGVRHEGSRVLCPGIGDNARGLTAMLTLAETLGANTGAMSLTRPIEFVATVGEEGLGNLRGAKNYFDDLEAMGVVPHAVLSLDGPGDTRIVHHALGSRRFRVTFRGPGGHSWADFGRANAVHAAARTAGELAALPAEHRGELAVTVGRIGGGEALTAIPVHAWLEVDVRATSARRLAQAEQQLRAIVRRATLEENHGQTSDTQLRADVELLGDRPAGRLQTDHPLVALAMAATRAIGRDPASAIASTDANIPLSRGIPAITIGAGGIGGGAHTSDEWFDNVDGALGISRALTILLTLAA